MHHQLPYCYDLVYIYKKCVEKFSLILPFSQHLTLCRPGRSGLKPSNYGLRPSTSKALMESAMNQ